MSKFQLNVWVTREFSKDFTHVIKGGFVDPQSATRGMYDLFCYDRNTGVGAFFATVRAGKLDDGTVVTDGPKQIGINHTFSNRWTHVVFVPVRLFIDRTWPIPNVDKKADLLLFYDAESGVGEFNQIDGKGDMFLLKRYTGWRTSWTHIIAGRFGPTEADTIFETDLPFPANLLFYDASNGVGEFYAVDDLGGMKLRQSFTGWRNSWHTIITGNFSNSPNDDLLFYDKSSGVGEFYTVDNDAVPRLLATHDTWRTTWQHVVSGQFLQHATFDGLLFYEEGSTHTEFYSTDGHGGIWRIEIYPGNQWHLQWHTILAGVFTPNIELSGLSGTSSLCNYDSRDGVIRYFFLTPETIETVIDLNGRWTAGSSQSAVITASYTFLSVDMSAFNRPAASGTIEDSTTISVTFPDDATFTGTLQPPNTIRWSNGSRWTKL